MHRRQFLSKKWGFREFKKNDMFSGLMIGDLCCCSIHLPFFLDENSIVQWRVKKLSWPNYIKMTLSVHSPLTSVSLSLPSISKRIHHIWSRSFQTKTNTNLFLTTPTILFFLSILLQLIFFLSPSIYTCCFLILINHFTLFHFNWSFNISQWFKSKNKQLNRTVKAIR